jgi:3-keto-5-aminohexanoate cleavage enzyme
MGRSIEAPDITKPLIISAALVGSWPTKDQNPGVPITEEEIAASAIDCAEAGAAIVHIHVRDDDGKVTGDLDRYARVQRLIRESDSDVIVNLSTSGGVGRATDEQRLGIAGLRPDIASFDAGSLNFGQTVFLNPPAFLDRLAAELAKCHVKPEIECFEPGHVANALRLIDEGKLTAPFWFQFVLGVRGGSPGTPAQLLHMLEMIPDGALWSVCGIGRAQLPLGMMAIAMGGHVRTGFEDNLFYHKGQLAMSNAQLVARLVRLATEVGRPLASPNVARAMLGIQER